MVKEQSLIENGHIFKMGERENFSFFICRGSKNAVYHIRHNKPANRWTCSCPNIRLIECSHIKAAKIMEAQDDKLFNRDKRINLEGSIQI